MPKGWWGWLIVLSVMMVPQTGWCRTFISLPMNVQGRELATVSVQENAQGLWVDATEIAAVLEPLIKPAVRGAFRAALTVEREWPLDEERDGVVLRYNAESVALDVRLPDTLLAPRSLRVQGARGEMVGTIVTPSALSGYVNMYAAETRQSNMMAASKRQPLRAELDGAVNVRGLVAEAQAIYVEPTRVRGMTAQDTARESGLTLRNRRVVKDDTARMVRYQAGELSYPTAGLQRYRPLVGAGVARRFDLQPYRVTQPSGRAEFLLESASTVEVYVNGARQQTLQLAAGTYSLSDFPVVNGANNVELVMTDAVGRVQRKVFPVISDGELLEKGLMSFAASAGVPQENSNDDDGGVFSGLWRYGMSDAVTVGANLQGDAWQQVVGLEAGTAGPWGMLHVDMAVSYDRRFGRDRQGIPAAAMRVDYRNVSGQGGRDAWQLSAEYRGASFNLPADPLADNPYLATLSASYTKSFVASLNWTVGAQYRFGRGEEGDTTLLTSNLLWRLDDAWSMTFDTLWTRGEGVGTMVGLTWAPMVTGAEASHSVGARYDSQRDVMRLDWMRRPAQTQLGLETDVGLERRGGVDMVAGDMQAQKHYDVAGTATYTGERGQIRVRQEATTAGLDMRSRRSRGTTTQLSVASALVFADGAWAVSRPVVNSFALVDGNVPVGVNPQMDARLNHAFGEEDEDDDVAASQLVPHYEARSGVFGGAVLPDLSAYLYRSVSVDVLPQGGGAEEPLQERSLVMLPAYRSGTRVRVAVTPRATVRGRLMDAEGTPLALEAGEIRAVTTDVAEIEPAAGEGAKGGGHMVFTDRSGQFSVHGLPHGAYQLVLANHPTLVLPFTLAATPNGVVDLGAVSMGMMVGREHSVLHAGSGQP